MPRCCSFSVGWIHSLVEMYIRSCEAYTVSPVPMTDVVAAGALSDSSIGSVTTESMSNPANSAGAWTAAQSTREPSD